MIAGKHTYAFPERTLTQPRPLLCSYRHPKLTKHTQDPIHWRARFSRFELPRHRKIYKSPDPRQTDPISATRIEAEQLLASH